ncbi:PIN domain-containing protein [Gracilinema caldarium]|uniref:PIN domain-containing protein n=1 Tax=Gracilinema caldarium TaxID=215591 RepID=UPI0026EF7112|nr:PIN domain-containing protein [Gracilinema caldarium]
MIKRVLVDTDIILDVALARNPFLESSKLVLALLENYIAVGFITSNEITNLYYILRKSGGDANARKFIAEILKYLTVITVEHADILHALTSPIADFKDSVQHNAALRNQCDCIITRNLDDYKYSDLAVYSPIDFLSLYKEII